jgi:hypothetical protein
VVPSFAHANPSSSVIHILFIVRIVTSLKKSLPTPIFRASGATVLDAMRWGVTMNSSHDVSFPKQRRLWLEPPTGHNPVCGSFILPQSHKGFKTSCN